MTHLLKKEKKYEWIEACEKSFKELKKKLTSAPVLTLPDIHQDFEVYCDASRQGLGCVLMQGGKVVAYATTTKQAIVDVPSQTVPLEPSVLGQSGPAGGADRLSQTVFFRTVCDSHLSQTVDE